MNKKQMTDYFKGKLNKGICKSLKIERNDDFNDFMELFKNHPEYETKLKDVVDLCIVQNKRNSKYFEINIIRTDGTTDDISYRCCINPRPVNYNLNSALRYTIEPQISAFREKTNLICDFCKSVDDIQIDHIIRFKDLSDDFLKGRNDIPEVFDDNNYNSCKFREVDKLFMDAWYEYHLIHSKLRCLCRKCNLARNQLKKEDKIIIVQ